MERGSATWTRAVAVAFIALTLSVAGIAWIAGGDERRVDAACGDWLGHRDELRSVVSESEEAAERAASENDDVVASFNNIDTVRAYIHTWASEGPRIQHGLHDDLPGGDGSSLEDSAEFTIGLVNEGVSSLSALIETGTPAQVLDYTPEASARFQAFDDICLSAARD